MPTINGRSWTIAQLQGYAHAQDTYGTGNSNFIQILEDILSVVGTDIQVYVEGRPYASEVIVRFVCIRAFTFPAGMAVSRASALTAATAQTVFSLRKNNVEFGTVTFAASGTAGTFAAATDTTFAPGDVLTAVAPATPDTALADIGFGFAGNTQ